MAQHYLSQNRPSLAAQCLRQCLTLNATDPLIYNELGVIYYRLGDLPLAAEVLEKGRLVVNRLPSVCSLFLSHL